MRYKFIQHDSPRINSITLCNALISTAIYTVGIQPKQQDNNSQLIASTVAGHFRGAKYSCTWFLWLEVWPQIFYPRMKQPCLPLPAVQAAITKILPTKCLNIAEPRIFCPQKITRYTVYTCRHGCTRCQECTPDGACRSNHVPWLWLCTDLSYAAQLRVFLLWCMLESFWRTLILVGSCSTILPSTRLLWELRTFLKLQLARYM